MVSWAPLIHCCDRRITCDVVMGRMLASLHSCGGEAKGVSLSVGWGRIRMRQGAADKPTKVGVLKVMDGLDLVGRIPQRCWRVNLKVEEMG